MFWFWLQLATKAPRGRPPLTGTQHDGTWYGIPGSVWPGWGWVSPPGCAPCWILVKIKPVLAKPNTNKPTQLLINSIFLVLKFLAWSGFF